MLLRELNDGVQIHLVESAEHGAAWRDGFASAYCRIFSGPPYHERFSEAEAAAVWDRLLGVVGNITLVAVHEGVVVGFGSAIPLGADAVVARALTGLVPVRHTMYLAELGIEPSYRGRGLGRQLVALRIKRMDHERFSHVVLRVADGRTESFEMYRRLDFNEMGVSMTVKRIRVDGEEREDERHFMSRLLSAVLVEE